MNYDEITRIWLEYRSSRIDRTLDPSDHMFSSDPNKPDETKWKEYMFVGESGARVIASALSLSRTDKVDRVLDFACGGGRVARHLRSLFPRAELFFADLNVERAEFCARQFGGTAVETTDALQANLPGGMDLIWVGSLFTHLNYRRMEDLFDLLWRSLGKNGTLIGTFHGQYIMSLNMKFISADKWKKIVDEFNATGIAYQDYGRPELGSVGVSVLRPEHIFRLAARHTDSRLACYAEAGWAGLQDVAAWWKV